MRHESPINEPIFGRIGVWRASGLGCGALVLACSLLIYSCMPHPPSNARVLRQFETHSDHFKNLASMLYEDENVGTVTRSFLFTRDRPFFDVEVDELKISNERLDAYLAHMNAAGVGRIDASAIGSEGEELSIRFHVWAWGGIDVYYHKGIEWIPAEYALDKMPGTWHIEDNWYLFSDFPKDIERQD